MTNASQTTGHRTDLHTHPARWYTSGSRTPQQPNTERELALIADVRSAALALYGGTLRGKRGTHE